MANIKELKLKKPTPVKKIKKARKQEHDILQAECFTWAWNTFPQLHFCMWSNNGNGARNARQGSQNISKGHYGGVLDTFIFYKSEMFIFDFKVGKDRLKYTQSKFISAMVFNGAVFQLIQSFEEWKTYMREKVIHKHYEQRIKDNIEAQTT